MSSYDTKMSSVLGSSKSKGLLILDSDGEMSNCVDEILIDGFGSSLGSSNERTDIASDESSQSDRRCSDSALSELSGATNGVNERKKERASASWKSSIGSLSVESDLGTLATIRDLNIDVESGGFGANLVPLHSLLNDEDNSPSIRSKNIGKRFQDFYNLGNDNLGSGAYACVRTATSIATGIEFAAKLISKHVESHTRERILREVDIFEHCRDHPNIIQLIEWFEDNDYFYMIFEKMHGGPLLSRIQRNVCFMEQEAGLVTKDIATALKHLHDRGIAHRDVKPENILCTDFDSVSPVKLCDMDLASFKRIRPSCEACGDVDEPDFQSAVGSAEFLAPEVVNAFIGNPDIHTPGYSSRCDMWSLGVIIYIMLCGYPPFYGECDRDNCGWDQGSDCPDCQLCLFQRIQSGEFNYPGFPFLRPIPPVRDVSKRYTAEDVLKHTWVVHAAPISNTILQTATNLSRNESQRDIQQMNELFRNCQVREAEVSFRSEGCSCVGLSASKVQASSF